MFACYVCGGKAPNLFLLFLCCWDRNYKYSCHSAFGTKNLVGRNSMGILRITHWDYRAVFLMFLEELVDSFSVCVLGQFLFYFINLNGLCIFCRLSNEPFDMGVLRSSLPETMSFPPLISMLFVPRKSMVALFLTFFI